MRHAFSLAIAALALFGTPGAAQAQTPPTSPPPATSTTPTGTTEFSSDPAAGTAIGGDRATMPAGTFGIGFVQTISGLRGGEIEYHLDRLMLTGALGFGFFNPDNGSSSSVIGMGLGGFFGLAAHSGAALFIGGRLVIAGVDSGNNDGIQFNIEVPLRAQWYVFEHFAFHAEVGAALRITSDGGDIAQGGRGKGTAITIGGTNLISTVGGTIYF